MMVSGGVLTNSPPGNCAIANWGIAISTKSDAFAAADSVAGSMLSEQALVSQRFGATRVSHHYVMAEVGQLPCRCAAYIA